MQEGVLSVQMRLSHPMWEVGFGLWLEPMPPPGHFHGQDIG